MIIIKSKREIELMKAAGEIVAMVLLKMEEIITPGIMTLELDRIAEEIIRKHDAIPSFKGYKTQDSIPPFPASICASVNDEVVHGIPDDTVLRSGDIISIDVGVYKEGVHADAARTFAVGQISSIAKRLIDTARASFYSGIKQAYSGKRLGDVSYEIQRVVEGNGFSVVREMVGHGIGHSLHEEPQIPNFGSRKKGVRLARNMALAIEPMINSGGYKITTRENKWTVATADGSLSAHYENTIIVTDNEPEILTI